MVTPLNTGSVMVGCSSSFVHLMMYGTPAVSVVTASPKVRFSVVPSMLASVSVRASTPVPSSTLPAMVTLKGSVSVFHAPSL